MTFRSDLDNMINVKINNQNTYDDALARYMRKRVDAFDIAITAPTKPLVSSRTSLDLLGPGGGSPGKVLILWKGQSNINYIYFDDNRYTGAINVNALAAFCAGLEFDQVDCQAGRSDFDPNSASIFSGSYEYAFDADDGPRWQTATRGVHPSQWPNDYPMDAFINFVSEKQATLGLDRPVILLHGHNEYMSRLDGDEIDYYEDWEIDFNARFRAACGGRSVALTPIFRWPLAYDSNTKTAMMKKQRETWTKLAADPANNYYFATGTCLDEGSFDGGSHLDNESRDRLSKRAGMRIGNWLLENGYGLLSKSLLTQLPTNGTFFYAVERIPGNNSKFAALAYPDSCTDIIMPTGEHDFGNYEVIDSDGSVKEIVGATKVGTARVEYDLATPLNGTGVFSFDYGIRTPFSGPESQITDNWHTLPKPAGLDFDEIQNVVMPISRNRQPILLGSPIVPPPGGEVVNPPTDNPDPDNPPVDPPAGPYLSLTSAHGGAIIESQNGEIAYIRIVRPIYPSTQLFNISVHNTTAEKTNTFFTYNPGYFVVINGAVSNSYELSSLNDGHYTSDFVCNMSDGTTLVLPVSVIVSSQATGPAPSPTAPPNNQTVVFYENFPPNKGTGALYKIFDIDGTKIVNLPQGGILLDGRASMMTRVSDPPGTREPNVGFGNGLFEICTTFLADNIGDRAGPANILWPSDDIWPGSEIDIGELDGSGRLYHATHWKDPTAPEANNGQNKFNIWPTAVGFHKKQKLVHAAMMQTDKITYLIDSQVLAVETEHPALDYAHGGVNHSIGIANDSSNTKVIVHWVRWTPEAKALADGGSENTRLPGSVIVNPPVDPGNPTNPTDPTNPTNPTNPTTPLPPYFNKGKTLNRYVAANTEYELSVWIKITAVPAQGAAISVAYPVGNGKVKASNSQFSALNVWELKKITFTPTSSGLATIIIAENIPEGTFLLTNALLASPNTKGGSYSRSYTSNTKPVKGAI